MEYQIRLATENDAQAVHDIYGAYVPLDYVTFTVDNPDVESYPANDEYVHLLYAYLPDNHNPRQDSTDSHGCILYLDGKIITQEDHILWR